MTHYLRSVTVVAVLTGLVLCVPVQAQTPEIDALRARAEQGEALAQNILGVKYNFGDDVPQDFAEAMRWLRLAAEQGHAAAQASLGLMYADGRGSRRTTGRRSKERISKGPLCPRSVRLLAR